MTEKLMGRLMEQGFVRESRNWAYGYFPTTDGVPLNVAVQTIERDALNLEDVQRAVLVPIRAGVSRCVRSGIRQYRCRRMA
ncbi:MAG: hypothetical protein ACYC6M_14295 [Terriglobales bacterium]